MPAACSPRVVIVGNPGEVHVGRHLCTAARNRRIDATLCDTTKAYNAPTPLRVLNWRLRGHRPTWLSRFSREVLRTCREMRPTVVIATGIAPIDRQTLQSIGALGIERLLYLTDDPWNPAHEAHWFFDALGMYDRVFTPRMIMDDLVRAGCRAVEYLPFGYAPDVHFPEPPQTPEERRRFSSDIVFVGAADRDRVRWMEPLVASGWHVALYGAYWERYSGTRSAARGPADARTVRLAIGGSRTSLCLVRTANRDGHSMRSLEVPAIGACMLVEDTPEHRSLFGADRDAVLYVTEPAEVGERLKTLQPAEGSRLASAARAIVTGGRHTWSDRLDTMMRAVTSVE